MRQPFLIMLLRHGQSEDNRLRAGHLYYPNNEIRELAIKTPDYLVPLSPEGIKQAEFTAQYLNETFNKPFDAIFHSDYYRTKQTAEIIYLAQNKNGHLISDYRIRERDPGYTYHMTKNEVLTYFPYLRIHHRTLGGFFFQPPGGESLAQTTERIKPFVEQMLCDYAGKKVLIVTHGAAIKCFRFLLEKLNLEQMSDWQGGSPKNCSMTTYQYSGAQGKLELKEYNKIVY